MTKKNIGSRTAAFYTLGCKVNQIETAKLGKILAAAGYTIVPFEQAADVYIINTCAVTSVGEKKSRQEIRRAHRQNPAALIVVTGCYAQLSPSDIKAIEGVGLVIGTKDREKFVDYLENALQEYENCRQAAAAFSPLDYVTDIKTAPGFEELPVRGGESEGDSLPFQRTRAFMKIQEGCENYCTYCIIPYTRGRLRSRPLPAVIAEARELSAKGYQEIVLTGIHLGAYGRDLSTGMTLTDAAEAILSATDFPRIRFSSLESIEVDDRFISLLKNEPRLCHHLHLPLQSGSDAILRLMNRHYCVEDFAALARRLREAIPDLALTTDIIVGFPGETEKLFQETLQAVENIAFSRIHVFPYSPRPGTPAATMAGQVPESVKKERVHRLEAVGEKTAAAFRCRQIDLTAAVLIEKISPAGIAEGLTANYLRVYTEAKTVRAGAMINLRLTHEYADGLWGEMTDREK